MTSELSDYVAGSLLDWIKGSAMPSAPAAVYIALYDGDPLNGGTEVTTQVRAAGRLPVTFGAIASRAISSSADVEYGASDNTVDVDYFAFYDASSSGNMLASSPLDTPRAVTSGDPVSFLAADVSITFATGSELSNYLSSAILNWFKGTAFPSAPTGLYIALHDGDPGFNGTSGTNVTTTIRSAGRVEVTFAEPTTDDPRVIASDAIVDFGASEGVADVDYFTLWDAASAGNNLGYTPLDNPRSILAGDPVSFLVGGAQFGFPRETPTE